MQDRIEQLERGLRRQRIAIWCLGGLMAAGLLAGASMRAADPTKVIIDKPVKIVIDDIGSQVRFNRPLPVEIKD
ncbi:MAG: hypothetical protein MK101_11785 [Phycisphaerales bacterium]|nr:hypothetical protein [Phycisphaerales bacterium]